MSAGQMRHWVTWQVFTGVDDGSGGQAADWTELLSTWAEVTPLSARQLLEAGMLQQEISHRVQTWYRADLLSERRALRAVDADGQIYAVRTLRDMDGRRILLEADAVQVTT